MIPDDTGLSYEEMLFLAEKTVLLANVAMHK